MRKPDITIRVSPSEVSITLARKEPPHFTLRHPHDGSAIDIEQVGRLVAGIFTGLIVVYDRPKRDGDTQVLNGNIDPTVLHHSGTAYRIDCVDGVITVDRAGMFCKDDDKQYQFRIPEDARHLTPLFLELVRYRHPVSTMEQIAAASERSRALAQRIAEDIKNIFAMARS